MQVRVTPLPRKEGTEAGGQPGGLLMASAFSLVWLMVDMD